MLKVVLICAIFASCLALETVPSQTTSENGFMPPPVTSVPQIIAQEQLFRKMADVYLGLQISSAFLAHGQAEAAKFKADTSDLDAEEVAFGHKEKDQSLEESDSEAVALEEESDGDDDNSFLELKSQQFGMFPGFGFGAPAAQPVPTKSAEELEHDSAIAKFTALKAMQIQFAFAASDVQKSYYVNKIMAMVLPPQLAIFKMYKSYLNTIALSTAFQFHDSFTQEAYLDDFNDHFGDLTGMSSQLSEAVAELHTFGSWSQLAMIKYQLFLINIYEKMMFGQVLAQASATQQQAYGAASYLELDSEPVNTQFFGFGGAPVNYMQYLQYYQMYLRYTSIVLEIQLSQTGASVATVKVAIANAKTDVTQTMIDDALKAEGEVLPNLYMQWASTNQMKYYIDYYSLMMDFFAAQLAVSQAADRAENVFQNLVQTEAPTVGPTETTKAN
jgi:hypothetical protein